MDRQPGSLRRGRIAANSAVRSVRDSRSVATNLHGVSGRGSSARRSCAGSGDRSSRQDLGPCVRDEFVPWPRCWPAWSVRLGSGNAPKSPTRKRRCDPDLHGAGHSSASGSQVPIRLRTSGFGLQEDRQAGWREAQPVPVVRRSTWRKRVGPFDRGVFHWEAGGRPGRRRLLRGTTNPGHGDAFGRRLAGGMPTPISLRNRQIHRQMWRKRTDQWLWETRLVRGKPRGK